MQKVMLINVTHVEESRVAILEDGVAARVPSVASSKATAISLLLRRRFMRTVIVAGLAAPLNGAIYVSSYCLTDSSSSEISCSRPSVSSLSR